MKELNLGNNKLKLTVGDLSCELRYPTHEEALAYAVEKSNVSLDDVDGAVEVVKKYFLSLGMSPEMYKVLTMSNIKAIHEEFEAGK